MQCKKRTENHVRNLQSESLIEQLLSDRDAEFRRAVKAERQLKELSDVKRMQADYEARLAEKEKASRSATGLWSPRKAG